MFLTAVKFNQPLDKWDVSNVLDTNTMFFGALEFNQNLASWDVSSISLMHFMFANSGFNQSISSWNVDSLTFMAGMFSGAKDFDQNLCDWGPQLPTFRPEEVTLAALNMFQGTSCPEQGPPFLAGDPTLRGPFCYPCTS